MLLLPAQGKIASALWKRALYFSVSLLGSGLGEKEQLKGTWYLMVQQLGKHLKCSNLPAFGNGIGVCVEMVRRGSGPTPILPCS